MRIFVICFLALLSQISFGQSGERKMIQGKISAASGNVVGVTICNLVNEKSTVSDQEGNFSIMVKPEDLLVFSSLHLEIHRKLIEEEDLKLDVLPIKMLDKVNQLDEVVVKKPIVIDAFAMGIIPEKAKHFTQMERKLYTAGDFKPIHLLGLLGGSLQFDPILNAINGRTKSIKKMIKVEEKIDLLHQIEFLFEEEYYVQKLNIPKEYIKGFQYYCVEDDANAAILKSKNKINIQFLMSKLAVEYNDLIVYKAE
ncbi:MAG: hypothetical protein ABI554_05740 [Flavobacterium sp.]